MISKHPSLIAYLTDEMSLTERRVIESHLSKCSTCQEELSILQETEGLIREGLAILAGEGTPQTTWADIAPTLNKSKSKGNSVVNSVKTLSLRTRIAIVVSIVMSCFLFLALTIAPVRAAINDLVERIVSVYVVDTPTGSIGGEYPFAPFSLENPPASLGASTVISSSTPNNFVELRYYNDQNFLILYEIPQSQADSMPEGQTVEINGSPGVLLENLSGEVNLGLMEVQPWVDINPQSIGGTTAGGGRMPDTMTYDNGIRLIWNEDELRIEMLSNLPYSQILELTDLVEATEEEVTVLEPEINATVGRAEVGVVEITKTPEATVSNWEPWPNWPRNSDKLIQFDILRPHYLPPSFYTGMDVQATIDGKVILENRIYDNTQFVVVTYRLDDTLPEGEKLTLLNGLPAVYEKGLSGTALLTAHTLQSGEAIDPVGGGGGGSSGPLPPGVVPTWPNEIEYTNGYRITWEINGVQISLLTNLSLDEALLFIDGLNPLGY